MEPPHSDAHPRANLGSSPSPNSLSLWLSYRRRFLEEFKKKQPLPLVVGVKQCHLRRPFEVPFLIPPPSKKIGYLRHSRRYLFAHLGTKRGFFLLAQGGHRVQSLVRWGLDSPGTKKYKRWVLSLPLTTPRRKKGATFKNGACVAYGQHHHPFFIPLPHRALRMGHHLPGEKNLQ